VSYSTNAGTIITGHSLGGGIVGHLEGGKISHCVNIGTILSKTDTMGWALELNRTFGSVGGIVGAGGCDFNNFMALPVHIYNCVNSGYISGEAIVGGIYGEMYDEDTIENCINTGVVEGKEKQGGIAGASTFGYYGQEIINCHYDKQMCLYGGINGTDEVGRAEGHLTKELIGTNLQSKLGNTD
jgi:hypothetical protein